MAVHVPIASRCRTPPLPRRRTTLGALLWAQRHIPLLADALLRIGSLSSERIFELMAWRCAATASRAVAHYFRGTTTLLNLNEYFICYISINQEVYYWLSQAPFDLFQPLTATVAPRIFFE